MFFKPKTHLYISEDVKFKGSDNINDYAIMPSRSEGQSNYYFPVLASAYGVDCIKISGKGMINIHSLNY